MKQKNIKTKKRQQSWRIVQFMAG